MLLLIIFFASVLSVLIPAYDQGACVGNVVYEVDYPINGCFHLYDCSSASCPSDYSSCTGLGVDAFYSCLGCAATGHSGKINSTTYLQYTNNDCTGFAIKTTLSSPCTLAEGAVCAAKSANFSATAPVGGSSTSSGGMSSTTSTTGDSSPPSSNNSPASMLEAVFFL